MSNNCGICGDGGHTAWSCPADLHYAHGYNQLTGEIIDRIKELKDGKTEDRIEERIKFFMDDNLHVVCDDEGDQFVVPTEKFAHDLAQQLTQLLNDEVIRELESLNTRRHYGKDYQESLDELDEYVTQRIKELIDQKEAKILDALYWMYVQYCSGGHSFMNAGEDASELLEDAGYIKVDGAGKILVDNGDSQEQTIKELKK